MGTVVIGAARDARTAERLWETEVRGDDFHMPFIDAGRSSVYLSDGSGKGIPASQHFRRLDLENGREIAKWRAGSTVRCLAPTADGDLIVSTGNRIARLDASTLAEKARWDGGPRYVDSIAVVGDRAIVANWMRPSVHSLDLGTGETRRKKSREMTVILAWRRSPVLASRCSPGLSVIDPETLAIRPLLGAPVARSHSIVGDEIWLLTGIGETIGPSGVERHEGSTHLECHDLTGASRAAEYELPLRARKVVARGSEVWLLPGVPGEQYVLTLPSPPEVEARVWRPAGRERIVAIDPQSRLLLTAEGDADRSRARISCYRLEA